MPDKPVKLPAGFAPAFALGIADPEGNLALVGSQSPLPVAQASAPAPAPLAGSTAVSLLAGPFAPAPALPVMLTLAGEWTGTVTLKRSTDGGATLHPLTMGGLPWARFTTNACEAVWEEYQAGAALYLDIALTAGTLAWRVAQ